MSELTYTRCGDYYIPDLKLSEQPEAPIGKYGRMRQRYLKEHRPGLYSSLILSEKLYPHLLEIDRAAHERMDAMLPRMMEAAGVTEELKAHDPIRLFHLTAEKFYSPAVVHLLRESRITLSLQIRLAIQTAIILQSYQRVLVFHRSAPPIPPFGSL